jgi:hypothetical protein
MLAHANRLLDRQGEEGRNCMRASTLEIVIPHMA